MATVRTYTAARMKQIEDTTVVGGEVVGDNLILKRRDNVTINAGAVRAYYNGPPLTAAEIAVTATPTGELTGTTVAEQLAELEERTTVEGWLDRERHTIRLVDRWYGLPANVVFPSGPIGYGVATSVVDADAYYTGVLGTAPAVPSGSSVVKGAGHILMLRTEVNGTAVQTLGYGSRVSLGESSPGSPAVFDARVAIQAGGPAEDYTTKVDLGGFGFILKPSPLEGEGGTPRLYVMKAGQPDGNHIANVLALKPDHYRVIYLGGGVMRAEFNGVQVAEWGPSDGTPSGGLLTGAVSIRKHTGSTERVAQIWYMAYVCEV